MHAVTVVIDVILLSFYLYFHVGEQNRNFSSAEGRVVSDASLNPLKSPQPINKNGSKIIRKKSMLSNRKMHGAHN